MEEFLLEQQSLFPLLWLIPHMHSHLSEWPNSSSFLLQSSKLIRLKKSIFSDTKNANTKTLSKYFYIYHILCIIREKILYILSEKIMLHTLLCHNGNYVRFLTHIVSQWKFPKLIIKYHRKKPQSTLIMDNEFQSDLYRHFL